VTEEIKQEGKTIDEKKERKKNSEWRALGF
jgi:hypothetical protein